MARRNLPRRSRAVALYLARLVLALGAAIPLWVALDSYAQGRHFLAAFAAAVGIQLAANSWDLA